MVCRAWLYPCKALLICPTPFALCPLSSTRCEPPSVPDPASLTPQDTDAGTTTRTGLV